MGKDAKSEDSGMIGKVVLADLFGAGDTAQCLGSFFYYLTAAAVTNFVI